MFYLHSSALNLGNCQHLPGKYNEILIFTWLASTFQYINIVHLLLMCYITNSKKYWSLIKHTVEGTWNWHTLAWRRSICDKPSMFLIVMNIFRSFLDTLKRNYCLLISKSLKSSLCNYVTQSTAFYERSVFQMDWQNYALSS